MREHNLSCGYCYRRSTYKTAIFNSNTGMLSKEGNMDNRPWVVKTGTTLKQVPRALTFGLSSSHVWWQLVMNFMTFSRRVHFGCCRGHDLTLHILDAQHVCSRHWDGHHAQSSHQEPRAGNWNPGKEIHSLCVWLISAFPEQDSSVINEIALECLKSGAPLGIICQNKHIEERKDWGSWCHQRFTQKGDKG